MNPELLKLASLLTIPIAMLISYSVIVTKYRLGKAAEKEKHAPVSGDSVSHGMVFKEGERGVNSIEVKSPAWYERLL